MVPGFPQTERVKVQNNPGVAKWKFSRDWVAEMMENGTKVTDATNVHYHNTTTYPDHDDHTTEYSEGFYPYDFQLPGFYDLPEIIIYKGETFEFYITAFDGDDCSELSLFLIEYPAAEEVTISYKDQSIFLEETVAEFDDFRYVKYDWLCSQEHLTPGGADCSSLSCSWFLPVTLGQPVFKH